MNWEKIKRHFLQGILVLTGVFAVWTATIGATATTPEVARTAMLVLLALSVWGVALIKYLYGR